MVKTKTKALILALLPALATAFAAPALADDTTNYPWIRPDNWLSQIIASPTGGPDQGHINVDIELKKSGQSYNPCQNSSDTFYSGCSGGVYKTLRYKPGSSDFPYGIFIDNANNNQNHFWARRIGTVFLEIYPYSVAVASNLNGYRLDPGACGCTVYGGFQVIINDWKGGYSANVGTLRAVSLADSDGGRLNGFAKRGGQPVKASDVNIDWFGQEGRTNHSSTGYSVQSFASWPTNSDGYYTSGPVMKGNYHIYVLDRPGNKKVECTGISIQSTADRQDIELSAPHFGLDGPFRQCYDRAP